MFKDIMAKRPSAHPKLAAIADALVGVIILFLAGRVNELLFLLIWLMARPIWWAVLVFATYYPAGISRYKHYLTLVWFNFTMSLPLIFAEGWQVRVAGIIWALSTSLSFWWLPADQSKLSFAFKPFRRWNLLLSSFGVFGLWSGILAASVFQIINAWSWWVYLIGAVLTAAASAWWWREYELKINHRFWVALAVLWILILETASVLMFLPFGFFAGGFLISWIWYLLWLNLRFYLSPEGLNLKKQLPFLITNAILLALYLLFIIRWK